MYCWGIRTVKRKASKLHSITNFPTTSHLLKNSLSLAGHRWLSIEGGLSWHGLSLSTLNFEPVVSARFGGSICVCLVGGFIPFEKYQSSWIISPGKLRVKIKNYLKPPPSFCCGRNKGGFREPVWNPHVLPWSLDCYCMEGAQTSSWCSMTLEMQIL